MQYFLFIHTSWSAVLCLVDYYFFFLLPFLRFCQFSFQSWIRSINIHVKESVYVYDEYIEVYLQVLYVAGTLRSLQYVLLDVLGEEYIVQYLSRVTGLKFFSLLHFLSYCFYHCFFSSQPNFLCKYRELIFWFNPPVWFCSDLSASHWCQ